MPLALPEGLSEEEMIIKESLMDKVSEKLEKVINANTERKKPYWVIAKVKFMTELGGRGASLYMRPCNIKPPVVKSSFVYEIDNIKGCKTLLWMCHPDYLEVVPVNKVTALPQHMVTPT